MLNTQLAALVLAAPLAATALEDAAQILARNVPEAHYSHKQLNDALSGDMLAAFIDSLDPAKRFFTRDDIDSFHVAYATALDDALNVGDLSPAAAIFAVLKQRVQERQTWVDEALASMPDFSTEESLPAKIESWQPAAEAKDLWRKMAKNAVLEETLKDNPPADPLASAKNRLSRISKRTLALTADEVDSLFLNAFMHSYDPHSDYFTPKSDQDFANAMQNKLQGIGARLRMGETYPEVVDTVPGSPASRAAPLLPGAQIVEISVDGKLQETEEMDLDELVSHIRGPENTTVQLGILAPKEKDLSKKKPVELVRATINLEEARAKAQLVQEGDKLFAVITLPSFYVGKDGRPGATARDVLKLLTALPRDVAGLILDLRNNGGGSLPDAVATSGFFIESGCVVQEKEGSGAVHALNDPNDQMLYTGPLIVLTNRASASASEILAACLQDYKRAVIVGSKSTWGKGTVQSMADLNPYDQANGGIKLTIAKFFRVSGDTTQFHGVASDIVLPSLYDALDDSEATLPHALPSDTIAEAAHTATSYVTAEHVRTLAAASQKRVAASSAFADLNQQIERLRSSQTAPLSLNASTRKASLLADKASEEAAKKADESRNWLFQATPLTLKDLESGRPTASEPAPIKDLVLEETLCILKDLAAL